jgi:hypothetical protein
MKNISIGLGVLFGLFAIIFLINANELFGIKFWGVKKENARREVFEQTQSYVEGKRQELTKLRLEYKEDTSQTDREALKQMILSDFANFDESKLPPDLESFLQSLKQ